jgi:citrate synthase
MRKLYDEVKLFSASLRQMFSASKKFASSLKDKTKANKILTVCKEIEENLVKELLEAIKKVTSNPTDTLALQYFHLKLPTCFFFFQ